MGRDRQQYDKKHKKKPKQYVETKEKAPNVVGNQNAKTGELPPSDDSGEEEVDIPVGQNRNVGMLPPSDDEDEEEDEEEEQQNKSKPKVQQQPQKQPIQKTVSFSDQNEYHTYAKNQKINISKDGAKRTPGTNSDNHQDGYSEEDDSEDDDDDDSEPEVDSKQNHNKQTNGTKGAPTNEYLSSKPKKKEADIDVEQARRDLERLQFHREKREKERLQRIKTEGWDRFTPISETNKPPEGYVPKAVNEDD